MLRKRGESTPNTETLDLSLSVLPIFIIMAAQDAKPFHWHYADVDDSNFKLHGHGLVIAILLIFSLALLLLCLYVWWACRSPPPAPGPPASGLDAGTIKSLPVVLMRHRGQSLDDEEGQYCSICLGALEEGDKVKVLPACGHAYHPECVDQWLRTHSSCPLCRASLRDEDRKKKVLDAC